MESNCFNCKFYNPNLCAVNPFYVHRLGQWQDNVSKHDLSKGFSQEAEFPACPDWKLLEALELLTLQLTLSRRQWQLAHAGWIGLLAKPVLAILPNSCPTWKLWKQFEPVMVELTLTRRQWQRLLWGIARAGWLNLLREQVQGVVSPPEFHMIPVELSTIPGIGYDGVSSPPERRMIPVKSTTITAIGYDSATSFLQIDFHNGRRDRYFEVRFWEFEELLEASSKDHYLKWIRKRYPFERIH